ncbi:MAG: S-adenosyl-l-methionine hydroxide adenosyltransferase family protein [Candidatus Methylumidiphilus sp.]
MILLYTDFGADGPYLGQMQAVLKHAAPGVEVINLLSNAPVGQPRPAAYLLAALARQFPAGSVFLCVVDPGVGGERLPVALEADGRWLVGPDNGLLNSVAAQASEATWRIITWRPAQLSASFHGRDLFAPVAARIVLGEGGWHKGIWAGPDLHGWPVDCDAVIYFDHYGNAITGRRHAAALDGKLLEVGGRRIAQARTFGDRPAGAAFWYCNSLGLVEIAVNLGRAEQVLDLALGQEIVFEDG